MLGCMIESELGIAQAAQLGSLADYIDLDGHLLISSRPFTRARASRTGGSCCPTAPGLGRGAGRWLTGSRSSPAASSPTSNAKTAHGILRYGDARGRRRRRLDVDAGAARRRGRALRAPAGADRGQRRRRRRSSARTCS